MTHQNWNIDHKEVHVGEGSVIKWEDSQFFTISFNGKSFFGEVLEEKTESNFLKVKINHREFTINKKGELDALISSLGMDAPKIKKLKELKAPMPGRIVNIAVSVGQEINVGDEILSLEAMKMENVLKAEGTGVVKEIFAKPDQVVEKGQVIIEFE